MTKPILPTNFYMSLMDFLLNAKQYVISVGDSFGLTNMQTVTLLLTKDDEPRSMSSFCKLYHCDASNVTGIIDGLEQKHLVSRHGDPSDRRIKVIKLEPAGRKMQQQILDKLAQSGDYLVAGLGNSEAQQFITTIEKIASNRTA